MRRALALLVAFVACLVANRAQAAKIVVWHAYRGAEQEALERILDDFRRAHAGDEVESLAIPFDAYASKLEAAIRSRSSSRFR